MSDDGDLTPTGDSPITTPHVVHATQVDDAFLTRIALIEDQPLGDRATAFRQLTDELYAHLDGTDGDAHRPGA
ncbi:hypothetical protein GCM10009792_25390 [Microcella alkalica]|uniref:Signal transduction protein with GAF and PtsI domain n=1 Tax=Microcella alkalica TaxID=355930 RepID=A0A839E849_9MICO|nr:hypothetical protein [Microcella alkalica]MBA8847677.1 signal transduction protein with GAF and PtsI domain [Microcella alkalica]